MTTDKLFAFFTKSLNNKGFAEAPENAWQQAIRDRLGKGSSDVIIVKPTEWNAPDIQSIDEQEVRSIGINRIGFAIMPILKKYNVSQIAINSCMPKIATIPFPNSQMVCFVFEYTSEWQDRGFI